MLLKISKPTLGRWTKAGHLRPQRFSSGRLRYSRREAIALLTSYPRN